MTAAARQAAHPGGTEVPAGALAITGFGVVGGAGIGPEPLAGVLAGHRQAPAEPGELFEDDLPGPEGHALTGFSVREHLGRKGTSFLDRGTGLGLLACTLALADAGLDVHDGNRARIGITLGTTHGSMKSTSDYSRATHTEHRPYHVNPVLFPNAVMNSVAGQAAIRTGLHGPNSTVAGGTTAMAQVLRYGRNLIGCGYADTLLAGTVEEFSPQHAWAVRAIQAAEGGDLPPGEGAAVFVVRSAAAVRAAGDEPLAEILAAEVGSFDPPGEDPARYTAGFAACLHRALHRARVRPDQVGTVCTGGNGMPALDGAESRALDEVVGSTAPRIAVADAVGESGAAFGGLQLACVLAAHRAGAQSELFLLSSRSSDGSVGVLLVRTGMRS
ncbi:beta-ketoacyl synthase N-terminal-like domain-containing protein [Amycolatopsis aidingensis]|uniref:beta-ketoacyl synthase N-terminal-like domain-containing protein n=1 Tax=Amycolatopsis aidingensis TaxID=2842453 RepID=UPI001C0D650C|nr:beta-ketoacyl synthase N-terminal-like domain-containing protein [Amycolatopsis aidingensis]